MFLEKVFVVFRIEYFLVLSLLRWCSPFIVSFETMIRKYVKLSKEKEVAQRNRIKNV